MNTISSTTSDAAYSQGSSSTGAATASTAASTQEADSATTNGNQTPDDNIQISTRAQNIQKLHEEFFPSGPKSIRITPDFVSRLYEYELISASEAESLSPATETNDSSETTSSVAELSEFTQRFGDVLEQSEPGDSLIATLDKAHSIIDAWQRDDPASMTEVQQVIADLTAFNASPEFDSLDHEDQKSMLELELAMSIAKKLNPENNVSQEINSYLDILNKYRL